MALTTTLSNEINYLKTLINNADDAHSNLYIARFSGMENRTAIQKVADDLTIRCDGFTPPPTDQPAYSVAFMNQSIERPAAKVNVTRNFSLTFRVDANYQAFSALLKQQQILFNPAQGYTATSINAFYNNHNLFNVDLEVAGAMVDTEPEFAKISRYEGCWISKISPISYTTSDSQPATVNMTVNFLILKDMHSGGLDGESSGNQSNQNNPESE